MPDAWRMRRAKTLLSLLLLISLLDMNATFALTDASVGGEHDVVGKAHASGENPPPPPGKEDKDKDKWRWPFADVTAPPKSQQKQNGSNCEDEETVPATCGYYARPSRGCSRPRLCRDCLQRDGCMINQFGACVNMSMHEYKPEMDYHKAFEFNLTGSGASERNVTLRYHFPALNATYCPETDATCLECKHSVFAGDVSDSRFCVGANNCICIASCEATGWEQLAGGLRCGPPPRPKAFAAGPPGPPKFDKPGNESEERSGVNLRDIWTMGGIPALVVVVGILVVRSHRLETRRREEAARVQREQEQQDGPSGESAGSNGGSSERTTIRPGRLNLAGWQASRREQKKKKEDLVLDSTRSVSPKHHFVDLLDTRPSVNPEVTILAAPVMGAMIVEASAPPLSPQHDDDGMEAPSAPSFDSDFTYDQEELDLV